MQLKSEYLTRKIWEKEIGWWENGCFRPGHPQHERSLVRSADGRYWEGGRQERVRNSWYTGISGNLTYMRIMLMSWSESSRSWTVDKLRAEPSLVPYSGVVLVGTSGSESFDCGNILEARNTLLLSYFVFWNVKFKKTILSSPRAQASIITLHPQQSLDPRFSFSESS